MSDRSFVAHAGVALVVLVGLLGTRPATGLAAPGQTPVAADTVAEIRPTKPRRDDVTCAY